MSEIIIEPQKKIHWISTSRRLTLAARLRLNVFDDVSNYAVGISEQDIEPVVEWCTENNCGTRVSFDMIRFKSKKHITMFLLRWG